MCSLIMLQKIRVGQIALLGFFAVSHQALGMRSRGLKSQKTANLCALVYST